MMYVWAADLTTNFDTGAILSNWIPSLGSIARAIAQGIYFYRRGTVYCLQHQFTKYLHSTLLLKDIYTSVQVMKEYRPKWRHPIH